MGLLSERPCDVVLIGSGHSADTLRLSEFLTRNTFPFATLDVNTDADAQTVLERFHVPAEDVPVVICRGEQRAQESEQFRSGDLSWHQSAG